MNVKVIKHTTDSEPSGMMTVNAFMQDDGGGIAVPDLSAFRNASFNGVIMFDKFKTDNYTAYIETDLSAADTDTILKSLKTNYLIVLNYQGEQSIMIGTNVVNSQLVITTIRTDGTSAENLVSASENNHTFFGMADK